MVVGMVTFINLQIQDVLYTLFVYERGFMWNFVFFCIFSRYRKLSQVVRVKTAPAESTKCKQSTVSSDEESDDE